MPEALQWLLLELGVMLALVPSVIAFMQWRRRRAIERALRALSQQIKQSEAERKQALMGVLASAHHITDAQGAEVADRLIRSERTFFRHCFNVMLSQDADALEGFSQNLYKTLDDYLRRCAADAPRPASTLKPSAPVVAAAAVAAAVAEPDDVFNALGTELTMTPALPAAAMEAATEEVDWNAAFAELDEGGASAAAAVPAASHDQAPAAAPMAETVVAAGEDLSQDDLDNLLNMLGSEPQAAEPAAISDDDIMAQWGAALEPSAEADKPAEADTFDLGWDDAFLEETVRIKPEEPTKDS
ncbi:hypothetical protein [Methylogaea oryzae]|uniref:Uncharacterized protein n=1 Tax=Methylogaea oryzae TaxID=1295382 RepID=A0A8D4VRD0_9GAMM|nr:hypothetical protein [Methylogaea oryzae]BBL72426.1 hypothetical protein MoryE10_30320 [Methylogaea oryzae]